MQFNSVRWLKKRCVHTSASFTSLCCCVLLTLSCLIVLGCGVESGSESGEQTAQEPESTDSVNTRTINLVGQFTYPDGSPYPGLTITELSTGVDDLTDENGTSEINVDTSSNRIELAVDRCGGSSTIQFDVPENATGVGYKVTVSEEETAVTSVEEIGADSPSDPPPSTESETPESSNPTDNSDERDSNENEDRDDEEEREKPQPKPKPKNSRCTQCHGDRGSSTRCGNARWASLHPQFCNDDKNKGGNKGGGKKKGGKNKKKKKGRVLFELSQFLQDA